MAFSNNCNCNKHCYAAMNRLKDKLPQYTLTSVFTNQQAFLPTQGECRWLHKINQNDFNKNKLFTAEYSQYNYLKSTEC